MNRNVIVGALIVLLIAGVGVWITMDVKQQPPTTDEQVSLEDRSIDKDGEQRLDSVKKFAELMLLGQNLTCTFQHTDGPNTTEGTVYLADRGERIRGDFVMTSEEAMRASMIRKDDWNYIWGFTEQGIKTQVTEEDKGKLFSNDTEGSPAIDDDVDFDCKRWKVDNSVFELPTDVEFVDISEQLRQLGSITKESLGIDCSTCDQVPTGEARDQCLQALGC